MEFWISGIIESEVGDFYLQTRKAVQGYLNLLAASEKYGTAVKELNVIFIINRDAINEYQRFMQKAQSLEARVRIDYDSFRDSSERQRIEIFTDALVAVIQKVTKFSPSQFNREALIQDIETAVSK